MISIERKTPALIDRLVEIWEASVRATHDFLKEDDIRFYKSRVWDACEGLPMLIHYEEGVAVAFLGMNMTYVSLLFVHPDYRGQGIGRKLMEWAMKEYHVETVAVNEQNEQAVGFYKELGFEVKRRASEDDQGRPYPVLYLQRKNRGTIY